MSDFTFLTEEQCFGNDKLDILEKRGTQAAITDFSILLGGWVSDAHIKNDSSLEGRTGVYWTKTDMDRTKTDMFLRKIDNKYIYTHIVFVSGENSCVNVDARECARPVLTFSDVDSIPTNGESGKRAMDGVLEVEYGYYPQKVASKDMQERLERDFKRGSLLKTGKNIQQIQENIMTMKCFLQSNTWNFN